MSDKKNAVAAFYCRVGNKAQLTDGKITALYCRTALADDEAIANQGRRLRRYAEENGYGNPAFYIDNGKNGLTLDRPAMKRLIDDIRAGKIKTVLVTDAARIARGFEPMAEWTSALRDIDVKCISINAGNDDFGGEFGLWSGTLRDICPELFKQTKRWRKIRPLREANA
jgi:DNA invertase Pin-like site-specific DNA recombinase